MANSGFVEGGFKRLGRAAYFREHRGNSSTGKHGSAVFVANIPSFGDVEEGLRSAFAPFGTVVSVDIDASVPQTTRCGRLHFAEGDAARRATNATEPPSFSVTIETPDGKAVVRSLVAAHQAVCLPSTEALLAAADKAMQLFEKCEREEAARRLAGLQGDADEDGFVTVTYKRKNREQGGGTSGLAASDGKKKRKKDQELKNFYRHQIREEKQDQLAELRARFEEDKARIAKLKDARKFSPF